MRILRAVLSSLLLITLIYFVFTSAASVPPPRLFTVAWDDRTLFEAGLVKSERTALEKLDGASVYHVDLEIADVLTHVNGRLEVLYENQENEPLFEVFFHLFPNLLGGRTDVQTVSVNGQSAASVLALGETVLCVPLLEALEPGEAVVISAAFSIDVPTDDVYHYGLFRYTEGILALSQCLPTIAVYDERGWNVTLPPEYGDLLYADSSFYLVRVTAPARLTLVGSGVEIDRAESDTQQHVTFAAGPVREFYLVASPRYTVLTEQVGETTVNSYAPPEQSNGAEIALTYAIEALHIYEDAFGPYPYTEFDIVGVSMTAWGMEYPGVIALGLSSYDAYGHTGNPADGFELTVAHEVAHQWFYNAVGNDQSTEPWLDESVVQYITGVYFQKRYGRSGYSFFHSWLEGRWSRVDYAKIPIGLAVEAYSPLEYSSIVYARGPLFIEALAKAMGEDVFATFLKDYYRTYKWAIATTEGFKELAENHCSCDLTGLFEEWVYGPKQKEVYINLMLVVSSP